MSLELQALLDLAMQHKWVALAALAIGTLVRSMKEDSPVLPINVPARWRPLLAILLGVASGVLQKAAAGTAWRVALAGGVVSGVAAIVGHDILIESLRGGKEMPWGARKSEDAKPSIPPVAAPEPPAADPPKP